MFKATLLALVLCILCYGAEGPSVPDLHGLTEAQCSSALASAGLILGDITTAFSPKNVDKCIDQNPAALVTVEFGSAVDIVLSRGTIAVPALAGLTEAAAESELLAVGLVLGEVTTDYSSEIEVDLVISSDPAEGEGAETSVDIVISLGEGEEPESSFPVSKVAGVDGATAATIMGVDASAVGKINGI